MTDTGNVKTTEPLFLHLIQSLAAGALQQLGKLVNPATGKTETHLEAARFSIDLIEAIEHKTRGNLSDDERRLLGETLTMLRLNYVETSAATPKDAPAETPAATPAPDAGTENTEAPKAEKPPEGEPPKFHKSYG